MQEQSGFTVLKLSALFISLCQHGGWLEDGGLGTLVIKQVEDLYYHLHIEQHVIQSDILNHSSN